MEEILNLKVKHLQSLIKDNYCIFFYKKRYLIVPLIDLDIKNFSFLYNDLIKNKLNDDYLFSSLIDNKTKLRKNNVIISLKEFYMELKIKHNLKLNLIDLINPLVLNAEINNKIFNKN